METIPVGAPTPPVSVAEATAALAAVGDDRRRTADDIRRASRWYAPTYGAIVAGILLAPAAPSRAFPFLVAVGTLALAALATTYRLRTRLWPRATSPLQVLAMVLVGVLVTGGIGVAWAAWHDWESAVVGWSVAVVLGVAAGALSSAFDHSSAAAMDHP